MGRRGPDPLYPWDRWFARQNWGKAHRLRRGRHFECQSYGMAAQLRKHASRRGLSVTIEIDEETVRFTVLGRLLGR